MRKALVLGGLVALLPSAGGAQVDTVRRGSVGGVVYDSVARAPLAGALVQMVLAADPRVIQSAVSGHDGRFVIDSVVPGRYLIGFQHNVLDSLALSAPTRLVDVRAGERTNTALAVPSPSTIVAALCPTSGLADSTGLLIGIFRDASGIRFFDSGTVKAVWQEIVLAKSGISSSQREVTAPVSREGWFGLCGIPAGVDVAVLAWRGADSTGIIAASVPLAGVTRRDLFLGGTARVRGTVRTEKDRPLPNARVGVAGRERSVITDSAGAFVLGETPAGSQTLEVRALGYAPELAPIMLATGSDTTVAVRLTSVKRVLDTIRVVGQRVYNRDSNGFLRRKRASGGYFFDQEMVQRERIFDVSRLLQRVPSVRQGNNGFTRTILMRGTIGYCTPTLVLNGMRMPSDLLADLDLLVRPEELEGMEVYRSTNTPAEFSSFDGCGAIVIWTRVPTRRPR